MQVLSVIVVVGPSGTLFVHHQKKNGYHAARDLVGHGAGSPKRILRMWKRTLFSREVELIFLTEFDIMTLQFSLGYIRYVFAQATSVCNT